jgi:hypothetical protein
MVFKSKHTKPAYCPDCKWYNVDCYPSEDEWTKNCDVFEPKEEIKNKEGEKYEKKNKNY